MQLSSQTYSGTVRQSYGGVGRNIADCLSRLGLVPLFISIVGHDVAGRAFIEQFRHMVCHCYLPRGIESIAFSMSLFVSPGFHP